MPYVILETFYPTEEGDEATKGCIPGAVSIHPSYLEGVSLRAEGENTYPHYSCPADGNLLSDELLHDALTKLGIDENTLVVVYGKGEVIPMISCRVIWSLMYAGVKDVRLLNGGYTAWREHGGPTCESPRLPVPIERFNATGACMPEYLATTEEVTAVAAGEHSAVLVDIRKIGEYDGSFRDNYPFFKTTGHIPSAIYQGNWFNMVDLETNRLKDQSEVRAHWESLGLDSIHGPLIFYCGTGWRSSIGFFLAYLMGWEAKNYDDSFYGWSQGVGYELREVHTCRDGCGCAATVKKIPQRAQGECCKKHEAEAGAPHAAGEVVEVAAVGEGGDA